MLIWLRYMTVLELKQWDAAMGTFLESDRTKSIFVKYLKHIPVGEHLIKASNEDTKTTPSN